MSRRGAYEDIVEGRDDQAETTPLRPMPRSAMIGVRVIVNGVDQCYQLVRMANLRFCYVDESYDDYIKRPKPNGYRSLHTVVLARNGYPVQVQVRTHQMHECAERGSAVNYK